MPTKRVPLHEHIAGALRSRLASGYAPGDRFPSQNELAREFGVSPLTAREAVAQLVQEGLLERRFGSGTYVNAQKPERYIGIVTELDISHPALSSYYPSLIQSIRARLNADGWMSRLYLGHNPPYGEPVPPTVTSSDFWMDLNADRLLGVLLVADDVPWFRQAIAPRHLPAVGGQDSDGNPLVDYASIVRQGVAYLIQQGCRRPACIDLTADGKGSRRLDLFLAEVSRGGLTPVPQLAACCAFGSGEALRPQAVFGRLWANQPPPDGLLVLDDIVYRQIAPLLLYNNIDVPRDLAVVTHLNRGDDPALQPAPVGLVVDPDEVAARMVAALLAQLPGAEPAPAALPAPIRLTVPTAPPLEAFHHR